MPTLPSGAESYQTVERAFHVLEVLAADGPRGVTEMADELSFEKSCMSRLLKTLSGLGYVAQAERRGRYRLGPRVLFLGERYLQEDRLVQEAQQTLEELAQSARASAHLAAPVAKGFFILIKVPSPERIQVASSAGAAVVPHASALGRVLLAAMPEEERPRFLERPLPRYTEKTITSQKKLAAALAEVKQKGYALEAGEEHAGVGCIGAPVRDASGRWVAAVSVSGPQQGTPFQLDTAHVDLVLARADELSRRLGYRG